MVVSRLGAVATVVAAWEIGAVSVAVVFIFVALVWILWCRKLLRLISWGGIKLPLVYWGLVVSSTSSSAPTASLSASSTTSATAASSATPAVIVGGLVLILLLLLVLGGG